MSINLSQIDYDAQCQWRGGDRVCTAFAVRRGDRVKLPSAMAKRPCGDRQGCLGTIVDVFWSKLVVEVDGPLNLATEAWGLKRDVETSSTGASNRSAGLGRSMAAKQYDPLIGAKFPV